MRFEFKVALFIATQLLLLAFIIYAVSVMVELNQAQKELEEVRKLLAR